MKRYKSLRYLIAGCVIALSYVSRLPAQNMPVDFTRIPSVKGECLVEIIDTAGREMKTDLTLQTNPALARIDNQYKIDRIEEIHRKIRSDKSNGGSGTAHLYKIKFVDREIKAENIVSGLKALPGVLHAEPNYIFKLSETIPDEYSDRIALQNSQWALDNIKAPEGWDLETGDTNVVIAILDLGVDWDHPDLNENIWINYGEIPDNGIDDDGNDYVDDRIGWDFVSAAPGDVADGEDAGPGDNDPMDFSGHGTHVSGIAGAVTNNSTGIAGLAWNCRIMAVRAGYVNFEGIGVFLYSDIVEGIYYAVDNGADIINMSFGVSLIGDPPEDSEIMTILKDAIGYADDHQVILVAAAGNDPIEGLNSYPAAFDEVLGVAATDMDNHKASFSAFNSDWIDVAAPGVDIYSTFPDDTYTLLSGTSMAAPLVSGLAALIKSAKPSFTKQDIITVIKNEVETPNTDYFIGTGIINVEKALQVDAATAGIAEITSPENNHIAFFDSINISGTVFGDNYAIEYGEGMYPSSWTLVDSGSVNIDGLITTWYTTGVSDGIYTLRLTVEENGRIIHDRITVRVKKYAYPLLKGWPVSTTEEIHSGAVVSDLDVDGKPEIIAYASDGYLYVWNSNGTSKPGWPRYLGASRADVGIGVKQNWLMGTPAIEDIDEDGHKDIVVGSLDGNLYILDSEGNDLPGFPVYLGRDIFSSPTVFDLNNDGTPEIICRSHKYLNVISTEGVLLPGWPVRISDIGLAIWSNQAVGDLDHDGEYEIVVGSHYYQDSGEGDNKVYAFHFNGEPVEGWPVDLNPSGEYTGWVLSSPAIGDLDGNGTVEVVIGSDDNRLWVLKGDGTNYSSEWPKYLPGVIRASPAIADLDGDGDLEIVIGKLIISQLKLFAFHHDGTVMNNWPYIVDSGSGGFTFGWISPVIGDINNDDSPDIISITEVGSFLGMGGGEIHAVDINAGVLEEFPFALPERSYSAVTLGDVDEDGDIDLIAGDLSGQVFIWDLPFHYDKGDIQWGQFRHDNRNTGLYGYDQVPPEPAASDVIVCEGDSVESLVATGVNVQWYSDSALINRVDSGNILQTGHTQVGTYAYYVTQTVNGLVSSARKVTLRIAAIPDPPSATSVSVCEGDTIPDLMAEGEAIRWYSDSSLTIPAGTGAAFASGHTLPGQYRYYVSQSVYGCESEGRPADLVIHPSPDIELGQDTVIYTNQDLLLGPFPEYYTYLWSDGSQKPYFEVSGSELGTGVHSISVSIADTNLCHDADSILVHVVPPDAQSLIQGDGSLKLFPNPATDILHIELPHAQHDFIIAKIYNEKGQELNTARIVAEVVNDRLYLSVSALRPGMYCITILTNREQYVGRFIVL